MSSTHKQELLKLLDGKNNPNTPLKSQNSSNCPPLRSLQRVFDCLTKRTDRYMNDPTFLLKTFRGSLDTLQTELFRSKEFSPKNTENNSTKSETRKREKLLLSITIAALSCLYRLVRPQMSCNFPNISLTITEHISPSSDKNLHAKLLQSYAHLFTLASTYPQISQIACFEQISLVRSLVNTSDENKIFDKPAKVHPSKTTTRLILSILYSYVKCLCNAKDFTKLAKTMQCECHPWLKQLASEDQNLATKQSDYMCRVLNLSMSCIITTKNKSFAFDVGFLAFPILLTCSPFHPSYVDTIKLQFKQVRKLLKISTKQQKVLIQKSMAYFELALLMFMFPTLSTSIPENISDCVLALDYCKKLLNENKLVKQKTRRRVSSKEDINLNKPVIDLCYCGLSISSSVNGATHLFHFSVDTLLSFSLSGNDCSFKVSNNVKRASMLAQVSAIVMERLVKMVKNPEEPLNLIKYSLNALLKVLRRFDVYPGGFSSVLKYVKVCHVLHTKSKMADKALTEILLNIAQVFIKIINKKATSSESETVAEEHEKLCSSALSLMLHLSASPCSTCDMLSSSLNLIQEYPVEFRNIADTLYSFGVQQYKLQSFKKASMFLELACQLYIEYNMDGEEKLSKRFELLSIVYEKLDVLEKAMESIAQILEYTSSKAIAKQFVERMLKLALRRNEKSICIEAQYFKQCKCTESEEETKLLFAEVAIDMSEQNDMLKLQLFASDLINSIECNAWKLIALRGLLQKRLGENIHLEEIFRDWEKEKKEECVDIAVQVAFYAAEESFNTELMHKCLSYCLQYSLFDVAHDAISILFLIETDMSSLIMQLLPTYRSLTIELRRCLIDIACLSEDRTVLQTLKTLLTDENINKSDDDDEQLEKYLHTESCFILNLLQSEKGSALGHYEEEENARYHRARAHFSLLNSNWTDSIHHALLALSISHRHYHEWSLLEHSKWFYLGEVISSLYLVGRCWEFSGNARRAMPSFQQAKKLAMLTESKSKSAWTKQIEKAIKYIENNLEEYCELTLDSLSFEVPSVFPSSFISEKTCSKQNAFACADTSSQKCIDHLISHLGRTVTFEMQRLWPNPLHYSNVQLEEYKNSLDIQTLFISMNAEGHLLVAHLSPSGDATSKIFDQIDFRIILSEFEDIMRENKKSLGFAENETEEDRSQKRKLASTESSSNATSSNATAKSSSNATSLNKTKSTKASAAERKKWWELRIKLDRLLAKLVSKCESQISLSEIISKHTNLTLILDDLVSPFPWELLSSFDKFNVTRCPSFFLFSTLCDYYSNVLSVDSLIYLVDPERDLTKTRKTFKKFFSSKNDIFKKVKVEGVMGEVPDKKDSWWDKALARDAFVYCGHGSGEQFIRREQLHKSLSQNNLSQNKSNIYLLIGCSSGALMSRGLYDRDGMAVNGFMLSRPGSTVVANLWDTTDGDSDRLSIHFIEGLVKKATTAKTRRKRSSKSKKVGLLLQAARETCKLKYLNGGATIIYGLPLIINHT